jgi:putative nucleotidyltransferase with HDIG domain
VAAKLVADASGADAEAAFTAGLLHDIGQLVLASNFPERYARVLALGALTESELRLAEQAMLDSDHLAVGALVAEHWRFPTLIVEAIANHHSMQTATATSALVRIVRAANQLIQAIELGATATAAPPATPDDAWAGTGLSANDWTRILSETEMQTQTICAALLN